MEMINALIYLLFVGIVVFKFRKHVAAWLEVRREINKIPGPYSYPLLGTVVRFMFVKRSERFMYFLKACEEYPSIYRTWAGPIPVVHLSNPDYIGKIVSSTVNLEKGFVYKFLHPWLGNGLLTSTGERWHYHRKIITSAFHFEILEKFMDVFKDKSNILLEKLSAEVNRNEFDIEPYITKCTLDIICETAMGITMNAQEEGEHQDYVEAIEEVGDITLYRLLRPWLYNNFIFSKSSTGKRYKKNIKVLHEFTQKVIKERKLQREKNMQREVKSTEHNYYGRKKKAFLDVLLDAQMDGSNFTDEEIREEVDTFMFEGHDTISAAICWTLLLLGSHQDIQEKVFQELKEIFGNAGTAITSRHLQEMKYLEQVIKESLRLYPSVPMITRKIKETVEVGGYNIPPGVTVNMHILVAHRNERYFPNPEKFNPDNFAPDNLRNRSPFSFIPFSAGPRNCIGQKFAIMEEKTILATILRRYQVTALEDINNIKLMGEIVLKPGNGVLVKLQERKSLSQ